MKLPRDCSGAKLIAVLCRDFGYARVNQEGSHVVLDTSIPHSHRISVPNHRVLRPGTLNGILRAVARAKGIEKADIVERL